MCFDEKAKYLITNFKTYFVIKHGNQMRDKYFKPENTFEKGIFALASTADANSPCTELKGLYFNMVVNESLKACFQPGSG